MMTLPWRNLTPVAIALVFLLSTAAGAATAAPDPTPRLVDIRAAHHPGFDRIVFEFDGGLPETTTVRWATGLRLDPSDKPARVQGNAFLRVRMGMATGHDETGRPTFGPFREAYALPNIAHVVLLGDFEGQVAVGIGLMERTKVRRTFRLRDPARYVIDISTAFPKTRVPVYFVDDEKVAAGARSVVSPVMRHVRKSDPARGALQRLYAGPTAAEQAGDLRFIASRTYGFHRLRTNRYGVTRVQLRGRCNSGGSAVVTVADQIRATLMARQEVRWVKIYGPDGTTIWPYGRRHSDPLCLQP
jgi:hypothetical protein